MEDVGDLVLMEVKMVGIMEDFGGEKEIEVEEMVEELDNKGIKEEVENLGGRRR